MRCDEVRTALHAEGGGKPRPEVKHHVECCEECAAFAARHRRITAGLRAFVTPPASADPLGSLLARLDAEPDASSAREREPRGTRITWSALLASRVLRIGWWGAVAALSAAHVVILAWPPLLGTTQPAAGSSEVDGTVARADTPFESAAVYPHGRRDVLPEDLRLERVVPVMSSELDTVGVRSETRGSDPGVKPE